MSTNNGKPPKSEFWRRCDLIKESTLTIQQKWALRCLADYAGDDGNCYVGRTRLAADCSLSVRQTIRLIRTLQELGVLNVSERPGKTDLITINWTAQPLTPVSPLTRTSPLTPVSEDPCHQCHPTPDMDVTPPLTPVSPEHLLNTPRTPLQQGGWGNFGIQREDFAVAANIYIRFRQAVNLGLMRDTKEDAIKFMRLGRYVAAQYARKDDHAAYCPEKLFRDLAERGEFRGTKDHEKEACRALERLTSPSAPTADTTNPNGHTTAGPAPSATPALMT